MKKFKCNACSPNWRAKTKDSYCYLEYNGDVKPIVCPFQVSLISKLYKSKLYKIIPNGYIIPKWEEVKDDTE